MVIGLMIKRMAMENIYGRRILSIQENIKMIESMVVELLDSLMVELNKVFGKMINLFVKLTHTYLLCL